jgi:integrating conjugative element protein (TIGR03758 family)
MALMTSLSAFAAAASVSPEHLSITIRSLLLVLLFFWAGASLYSELHHFRHHEIDLMDVQRKVLRILFIVALAVILVFVV